MFMQHHNDTIIKTWWQRRRKTSLTIYLPLTLLQGFEKVVWGFTVRGSWTSNITAIFWPSLLWLSRCVFLVLWCSTGGPEADLLGDGSLYGILSAYSPDLNSSGPKGPFGLIWLSLPHFLSNCLELQLATPLAPWRRTQLEPELNSTGPSNSTELYNGSTPNRSLKSNV